MDVLVPLILAIGTVTLIGHALWLFFAWLVRLATGGQPRQKFCPRCGLALEAERCEACGWPWNAAGDLRSPGKALGQLARQVEQLVEAGVLKQEAAARIVAAIDAERRPAAVEPAPRPIEGVAPAALPAETSAASEEPVEALLVDEPLPREVPAIQPPPVAPAEIHPLDRPEPVHVPPARPAVPKRSWSDVLAAFMEERNIRWGELIGGLLIVCGSIALVISFWSAIAERTWLKFLLFNGVTAGLFALGLYSEHRWRLHTTSQGLLSIATLLVPLNFLAIAALTSAPDASAIVAIAGELATAAFFGALIYFAARTLVPDDAPWLCGAVMLPALSQLLVRRFVEPGAAVGTIALLAALPAVCYLAANLRVLWRLGRVSVPAESEINGLFKFLGLSTFTVLLPIGLVLYRSGTPWETLRQLPALLGALGLAPLAAGLLVWRKLAGRNLAALRTAGTSIAVCGAAISLASLVVAWPEPQAMLPAAVVQFVLFTLVAWRYGLPAAHVLAAACLALAYVLAVQVFDGVLPWSGGTTEQVAAALLSGTSGVMLVPLAIAYAAAALLAARRDRRTGMALISAGGTISTVSIALVAWHGLGVEGDPLGAAWVFAIYAAAGIAASARLPSRGLAWIGIGLLLASIAQGVIYRFAQPLALPAAWLLALLIFASMASVIGVLARRLPWVVRECPLVETAWSAACLATLAAVPLLAWLAPARLARFEAIYWAWLAVVWLVMAIETGWLPVATLFQLALVLATLFGAVAILERREWFRALRWPWLDPWTFQSLGLALAALALAGALMRAIVRRLAGSEAPGDRIVGLRAALASPWLAVDRVLAVGLIALTVALASYAALPGVLQELSPRAAGELTPQVGTPREVPSIERFALPVVDHVHAADSGTWALVAAVLMILVVVSRESLSTGWLAGMFITAAAVCPLVAAHFTPEVAVASALRWLSAGYLLVASIPIWWRAWIGKFAQRLGWPDEVQVSSARLRDLVFFLALLPPVVMAIVTATGAIARMGQAGQLVADSTWFLVGWLVAMLATALLLAATRPWGRTGSTSPRPGWPDVAAGLILVLGTAPLVAMVLYHVGLALRAHPILGPNPDSIFFRMGLAGSYAAPILVTAIALIGYALRERSSGFALAGGLVLNAGATAAYLLAIAKGGLTFDTAQWLRLAQLNAAVAAVYLMIWMFVVVADRRRTYRVGAIRLDSPTGIQAALGPGLMALALGVTWARLFVDPVATATWQPIVPQAADAWAWLSFCAVCASVCTAAWATGRQISLLATNAALVGVAVLVAGVAGRWDSGNWLTFNTLGVGHAIIGLWLLALAWLRWRGQELVESPDGSRAGAMWIVLQAGIILAMSLRGIVDQRWWAAAGCALVGLKLLPGLALVYQRRRYLYLAAPVVNLAGLLAADQLGWITGDREFVYWNIVLAAILVPLWLWIELASIRRRSFATGAFALPVHRLATWITLGVLVLLTASGLFADANRTPRGTPDFGLQWWALGAVFVACVSCLWDVLARERVALVYVWGLSACAVLLDILGLEPRWLLWTGTLVLAAYALATSYLWSRRGGLLQVAEYLRIPHGRERAPRSTWLVGLNSLLIAAIVAMTFVVLFTSADVTLRVSAAQATLAQVVSLALLARGDRRGTLQMAALVLGAIGAIAFGWAWLPLAASALDILVVIAVALALVTVLYGMGLVKLLGEASDWLAPARRLTPALVLGSGAALVAVLGLEAWEYVRLGEVMIGPAAITAVALALVGLAAAALTAAVLPGRDPLSLSERGRTSYVYAAEIILALLFVHIRLTMPWLFSGFFSQYWPLIVMGIAFLGVGAAELCRRRQVAVLAEPLENTGAMLPVLPVLGFWAVDSSVHYSLLLVSVGLLYAGLSVARRSFGFGVLAALAANGGLWFFLRDSEGWGLLTHPQVWLIPPALCVLAAAYLNRQQLSEAQMTAIRYVTSMAIYVSSTADIFLNGVADHPWLPLVLAGLSILGIAAGILLRVRAFLFLGTGFLIMALFTMIWYAAVDLEQTWIWWACVVAAGVGVIATVALFEKKRRDILDVVERLKQWDA